MPGPTWPNRFFANAASSGGLDRTPKGPEFGAWMAGNGFQFQNGTLFTKRTLDWNLYVGDIAVNMTPAMAGVSPLGTSRLNNPRIRLMGNFENDLKNNYTAQYTFIGPKYSKDPRDSVTTYRGGNSQHPIDDVVSGDRLIARVYNAIRQSPLWKKSMLIITWDEHGGFYDHVPPPRAPKPGDHWEMDTNSVRFQPPLNSSGFGVSTNMACVSRPLSYPHGSPRKLSITAPTITHRYPRRSRHFLALNL